MVLGFIHVVPPHVTPDLWVGGGTGGGDSGVTRVSPTPPLVALGFTHVVLPHLHCHPGVWVTPDPLTPDPCDGLGRGVTVVSPV